MVSLGFCDKPGYLSNPRPILLPRFAILESCLCYYYWGTIWNSSRIKEMNKLVWMSQLLPICNFKYDLQYSLKYEYMIQSHGSHCDTCSCIYHKTKKRQQTYLGLNTTFPWPYFYIELCKSYYLAIFSWMANTINRRSYTILEISTLSDNIF